ncbi:unnamed protein product [marine sediment metagenome]|uniref:Uncharacterized protein n=1 Tax=marine sediment metagenome TaxID=412755 RepID=X1T5J1_9ZZZZ
MSLDKLLMERFKVRTRAVENPKAITAASTTAQLILGINPNRLAFTITNLGAEECYVGLTNKVSTTRGIRLDGGGGFFICIWDEDFQMTGWAWWIIAEEGTPAVFSLEVVEYGREL